MNHRRSLDVNLNLNVRGLKKSATLLINELSNELRKQGKVYKLGLGQSPFPVPEPVQQSLRDHAHEKDYLPVMGLPELREAVANHLNRLHRVGYRADDIMIGPGSKELMFILQLVYYGDLVIPTPSWVSYAPQAHIIGRQLHWIPTTSKCCYQLTPEALEQICADDPGRPRLIILNYPANPHGCTYRLEELKEIARIARKYRVLLLSDEIYGQLHHSGRHVSVARFYPEGTIISTGLSKWCGAGGWRLGAFAFPDSLEWLKKAMGVVASETFTSTSAPIQYAAVTAFHGCPELDLYLRHSRRVLRTLGLTLAEMLLKAVVEVPVPKGAFYLFPSFDSFRDPLRAKGITTSEELCHALLRETGVAILPGSDFGRPEKELTARIAYVDFDGEKALKASASQPFSKTLNYSFVKENCHDCLEAVNRITDWLLAL